MPVQREMIAPDVVGADFLLEQARGVVILRRALGQLLLKPVQRAVAQLGGAVVVELALGLLDIQLGLLNAGLDVAHHLNGALFALPLAQHLGLLGLQLGQLLFQLLQTVAAGGVGFALEGLAFDFQLHHAAVGLVQVRGQAVYVRADHGRGLVDEVDGLVRQLAVADVAAGEGGRLHDGRVADAHAVVHLEAFLQAAQNGDGVLHARLVDHDGLEAPLQGRVLLDVLAVFIGGGGADAVQLATRQQGLEHVACVHCALGLARAHDGVHLVDEQDDAAFALLHVLEHGLEPLLELAAVLGPGDERAHVEGEDGLVLQALGHVLLHYALGQALGYGGLAHAGLADEHGVVLGAAREDAHHAPDLLVAADDRVELAALGLVHQVAAILLQRVVGVFRVVAGHALVAAHLGEGGEELVARQAELAVHLAGTG